MDAQLLHLTLDTDPGVLSLIEDVLGFVLHAAHGIGALEPLASSCSKLNELARSRVPVQLRVKGAADALRILNLHLMRTVSRPPFSACDSLLVVAKDAPACHRLPGVLVAAAGWANLTSLDLTAIMPDAATATAAAAAAAEEADEEAAAAAAAAEVHQAVLEEYDSTVVGLISPTAMLQQLQRLKLTLLAVGPLTAGLLGQLTAPTSLQLRGYKRHVPPLLLTLVNLSPLSRMRGLVELVCRVHSGPMAPAAADGPFALPSTLRRLQLEQGDAANWLQHLPGCPRLEELSMQYAGVQHASAHPAAVLQLAARHTPGLCKLTCAYGDDISRDNDSDGDSDSDSSSDDGDDEQTPSLPILSVDSVQQQLAALTALQHLDVGSKLTLGSAVDWEALSSLSAVTCLRGIVVEEPPPRSWQHPRVQQLHLGLQGVDGAGAAAVLRGFPAAQQAHLRIEGFPDEHPVEARATQGGRRGNRQGLRSQQGVPRALSSLTSLRLKYDWPPKSYGVNDSYVVHAAPILAAASGVAELDFDRHADFKLSRHHVTPVPDLSPCSALTSLRFGAFDGVESWHVVEVVQPLAPTLRALVLHGMRSVTPKAATELQGVLPHLEHVSFEHCLQMCKRRQEFTGRACTTPEAVFLSKVRKKLRPGLALTVSDPR